MTLPLCLDFLVLLLVSCEGVASYNNEGGAAAFKVHPPPGGSTGAAAAASPWYTASVGVGAAEVATFVWFTSAAARQNDTSPNVPHTSLSKDTSFISFDVGAPTPVTISLLNGTARTTAVLPSSAAISATIAPSGTSVLLTVDRPRQVCVVINGNMDKPLCIFADPVEDRPPAGPSDDVIYFGPGVHVVAGSNITISKPNMTVYIAGGALVYGQIVAPVDVLCDGLRVHGRGVLSGHRTAISNHGLAMVEARQARNILVEGITTIDAPHYQIRSYGPGGTIRWAKAVAWGFSTDGWSLGAYSLTEDSFFKVNDDSVKMFYTGTLVQRLVIWQMENGCPFMMSWNTAHNVGFLAARDSDIIAHERTGRWHGPDGVFCAVHGGIGNLNNYLFSNIRVENAFWAATVRSTMNTDRGVLE